jgi:hypothetical protein
MMILLFLLAFLGNVTTAPLGGVMTGVPKDVEIQEVCIVNSDEDLEDEATHLLREGLLNNSKNVQKINSTFHSSKLCVNIAYHIFNCTEQECNSTRYDITWTGVDTNSFSGNILYWFANINWDIIGFEWADTCDQSITDFSIFVCLPKLDFPIENSLEDLTKQV